MLELSSSCSLSFPSHRIREWGIILNIRFDGAHPYMTNPALAKVLASYVPQLIQKRVAADPSPIESPVVEEFQAAVLFADISGFTHLTESLAEAGPAGVETIANILNEYFSPNRSPGANGAPMPTRFLPLTSYSFVHLMMAYSTSSANVLFVFRSNCTWLSQHCARSL